MSIIRKRCTSYGIMKAIHLVNHFQSKITVARRGCTDSRCLTPSVSHLINHKQLTLRAIRVKYLFSLSLQRCACTAFVSLLSHGRLAVLWCANGTAACLPWFVIMQSGGRGAFLCSTAGTEPWAGQKSCRSCRALIVRPNESQSSDPTTRARERFAGNCQNHRPA